MLTGKQKRHLRAIGNTENSILQIGKTGINDNNIIQAQEALQARELIKVRVLSNCPKEAVEVAVDLAQTTGAELVQVLGRKFLLFKPSTKDPKIKLPQ